jgi:hypothetical protein
VETIISTLFSRRRKVSKDKDGVSISQMTDKEYEDEKHRKHRPVDPGYGIPGIDKEKLRDKIPHPDHTLPGTPDRPGHELPTPPSRPDQGLPEGRPHPDNSLPTPPPHADNTLPENASQPWRGEEVPLGASHPDQVPPSVEGTSQEPADPRQDVKNRMADVEKNKK